MDADATIEVDWMMKPLFKVDEYTGIIEKVNKKFNNEIFLGGQSSAEGRNIFVRCKVGLKFLFKLLGHQTKGSSRSILGASLPSKMTTAE